MGKSGKWLNLPVLNREEKKKRNDQLIPLLLIVQVSILRESRGSLANSPIVLSNAYATAIYVCGQAHQWQTSLILLDEFVRSGQEPNTYVLNAAIGACSRSGQAAKSIALLETMKGIGLKSDVKGLNSALASSMQGDWKLTLDTLRASKSSFGIEPNGNSYAISMSACLRANKWTRAVAVFDDMKRQEVAPDTDHYNMICNSAFYQPNSPRQSGRANTSVGHIAKEAVWKILVGILEEMHLRGMVPTEHNVLTAMRAFSKTGAWEKVIDLFELCERFDIEKTNLTWGTVLSELANNDMIDEAKKIMVKMKEAKIEPNKLYYAGMATVAQKSADWKRALGLLRDIESRGRVPDIFCYNKCIGACGDAEKLNEALSIFDSMHEHGVLPNIITYTAIIKACGKCGNWEKALEILQSMEGNKTTPNVITWTAALHACGSNGQLEQCFHMLEAMKAKGIQPNVFTYTSTLNACAASFNASHVVHILNVAQSDGVAITSGMIGSAINTFGLVGRLEDALDLLMVCETRYNVPFDEKILNCVIAACARNSEPEKAAEIFSIFPERGFNPDIFTICSLISAYGAKGKWPEALALVDSLPQYKIAPDDAILNAAITACGNGGESATVITILNTMDSKWGVKPSTKTFNAAIGALATCGKWREALDLLESMEGLGAKPDVGTINTALGSLSKLGKFDELVAVMVYAQSLGLQSKAWAPAASVDLEDCSSTVARDIMRVIANNLSIAQRRSSAARRPSKSKQLPHSALGGDSSNGSKGATGRFTIKDASLGVELDLLS